MCNMIINIYRFEAAAAMYNGGWGVGPLLNCTQIQTHACVMCLYLLQNDNTDVNMITNMNIIANSYI